MQKTIRELGRSRCIVCMNAADDEHYHEKGALRLADHTQTATCLKW